MSTSNRDREISTHLPLTMAEGFCQPLHVFKRVFSVGLVVTELEDGTWLAASIPSNGAKVTEESSFTSFTREERMKVMAKKMKSWVKYEILKDKIRQELISDPLKGTGCSVMKRDRRQAVQGTVLSRNW